MNPDDLLYSKEHEWLRVEGDTGLVGITSHAQEELGDVVYVELPKVGDKFDANEAFGTVESVKAVSEMFMPVSGEITEINAELENSPGRVNDDSFGKGWMVRIRITNPDQTGDLLSAEAYGEFTAAAEE